MQLGVLLGTLALGSTAQAADAGWQAGRLGQLGYGSVRAAWGSLLPPPPPLLAAIADTQTPLHNHLPPVSAADLHGRSGRVRLRRATCGGLAVWRSGRHRPACLAFCPGRAAGLRRVPGGAVCGRRRVRRSTHSIPGGACDRPLRRLWSGRCLSCPLSLLPRRAWLPGTGGRPHPPGTWRTLLPGPLRTCRRAACHAPPALSAARPHRRPLQVNCRPPGGITVHVDQYRADSGAWLKLALRDVAGQGDIVGVSLAPSAVRRL